MKMSQKKESTVSSKAVKSGFWYTVSNFLTKGVAFLSVPFFTRLMTQEDIGNFSNISSWVSILAIVLTLEIYSSLSIARFDYKEKLDEYISSNLLLCNIVTICFYVVYLAIKEPIEQLLMVDTLTMNLIFMYLLAYPAFQMFTLKCQFKYAYKPIVATSMINVVGSTLLSLGCVVLFENKLLGRIVGYFIPLIAVSLFTYVCLLAKGKKVSPKYWKYALKVSIPLVFHLLASYLLGAADKIMITKMVSPEANALYSVAYSISIIATTLWSSMNGAWSPWSLQQIEDNKLAELRSKSKPYTLLYFVVIVMLLCIAPELLFVMGGETYMVAKFVLPPVLAGCVFQFIYSLYVNVEFYYKKQIYIATGTIIAAVVNIILNYLLIPVFGYIAAAYTTLVGYVLLLVIHYLFVHKLKRTDCYDTKFLAKIATLTLIMTGVFSLLYVNNLVRYILLGIILILMLCWVIAKRKLLSEIIKTRNFKKILTIL